MNASQITKIKERLEATRHERLLLAERGRKCTIDVHEMIKSSRQIVQESDLDLHKIRTPWFSAREPGCLGLGS